MECCLLSFKICEEFGDAIYRDMVADHCPQSITAAHL
jgi:hypothetical protein